MSLDVRHLLTGTSHLEGEGERDSHERDRDDLEEAAQDRGDEHVHDRVMHLFFAGVLRFLGRAE